MIHLVFIGDLDDLGAPNDEHKFVPRVKVRSLVKIVGSLFSNYEAR